METHARVYPEVKSMAAAELLPDPGELLDDELEAVVGGLERIWLPGDVTVHAGPA